MWGAPFWTNFPCQNPLYSRILPKNYALRLPVLSDYRAIISPLH